MAVNVEKKRLDKIGVKKPIFKAIQCTKCRKSFINEEMWVVPRWGNNEWKYKWYYCKHCFQTKEQVLNEIDNDSIYFGIYGIDPYPYNPNKKRLMRYSELPSPNGDPVLIPDNKK